MCYIWRFLAPPKPLDLVRKKQIVGNCLLFTLLNSKTLKQVVHGQKEKKSDVRVHIYNIYTHIIYYIYIPYNIYHIYTLTYVYLYTLYIQYSHICVYTHIYLWIFLMKRKLILLKYADSRFDSRYGAQMVRS